MDKLTEFITDFRDGVENKKCVETGLERLEPKNFVSGPSSVGLEPTNCVSQQISESPESAKRVWLKMREYITVMEAENFVADGKIWEEYDLEFTLEGTKVYYRCSDRQNCVNECPMRLYLLYHSTGGRVTVYKTEDGHTNHFEADGKKKFDKTRTKRVWLEKGVCDTAVEAEKIVSDEEIWKKRNIRTSEEGKKRYYYCSGRQSRENGCPKRLYLLYHSTGGRVSLYETEDDHANHEKKKSRNTGPQRVYLEKSVHNTAAEAEKIVWDEEIWVKARGINRTSRGKKQYYKCSKGQFGVNKCPKRLYLMYHSTGDRVSLYETKDAHANHVFKPTGNTS